MNKRNILRRSPLTWALAAAAGLMAAADLPAATPDNASSLIVHYYNVDLSTPAGAQALYERIVGAAERVCADDDRGLEARLAAQRCYDKALGEAVASVNSPQLNAIYRQHGLPLLTTMR